MRATDGELSQFPRCRDWGMQNADCKLKTAARNKRIQSATRNRPSAINGSDRLWR
jgi:hypothetical protein